MNDAQPAVAGTEQAKANASAHEGLRVFDKPHYEPEALIDKLARQGMTIDPIVALPYLRQVGAYRLKGFWYQWQDPTTKRFREGTHFNQVIERYEFDRELRRITSTALERIELMVRATISNVLSRREGPHWFMDESVFKPASPSSDSTKKSLLEKVKEEVERMKDKQFIAHYRRKYSEPPLPPSWAISECLSFGVWSHAYSNLQDPIARREISIRFGVNSADVFAKWLHAFSVMRNTVAHHGRLLGTQTAITPADYKEQGLVFERNRTFFVMATAINYICKRISRGPRWHAEIKALFAQYPAIPIHGALGFPDDWEHRPGWTNDAATGPVSRRRKPARKPMTVKSKQFPANSSSGTALSIAMQAAIEKGKS